MLMSRPEMGMRRPATRTTKCDPPKALLPTVSFYPNFNYLKTLYLVFQIRCYTAESNFQNFSGKLFPKTAPESRTSYNKDKHNQKFSKRNICARRRPK